jgi:Grx4 family monothiol glutaredoxin
MVVLFFSLKLNLIIDMAAVAHPASADAYDAVVGAKPACVVYFRADWCEPCHDLDVVFAALAADTPALSFVSVDAEGLMDVSERMRVETLPCFVALRGGAEVGRLAGANAPALVELVAKTAGAPAKPPPTAAATTAGDPPAAGDLDAQLRALVASSPNMLFMKGSPDEPRCGFSRQIVEILRAEGVPFGSFDILSDEDVRQGLKALYKWPTFPQLYAHGALVGGLDIVKELKEDGSLKDELA